MVFNKGRMWFCGFIGSIASYYTVFYLVPLNSTVILDAVANWLVLNLAHARSLRRHSKMICICNEFMQCFAVVRILLTELQHRNYDLVFPRKVNFKN